jgi:carboxyl-terminal processing protease
METLLESGSVRGMSIEKDPSYIGLHKDGATIIQFPRPSADDAEGWAGLTARILQNAAETEPNLRTMPAEALYQTVMNGVVGDLDRNTRYVGARDAANQRASREGFSGIGITIKTEAGLTHVVEVMEGTPAALKGLEVGDLLTHADGQTLQGLESHAVVTRLRGPIGSALALSLERGVPPQNLTIKLRRTFVIPPTVYGQRDGNIVVLRVTGFNINTAADVALEYSRLSTDWRASAGLVLDLRSNPGGLLDQAVLVADLFLDRGFIISTLGRHPASNSVFTADESQIAAGLPIVILTNGDSASAAELLTAALQDRRRAVVVGTTTHGKGSVQNLVEMPNGGELVLTWSRLHAPSGYILDGLGVLPNICTSADETSPQLSQVFAKVDTYAKHAVDWHGYQQPNLERAKAFRKFCPPGPNRPNDDMMVAKLLLQSPALYQRALTPAVESAAIRHGAAPGNS